jgi:signal transduction histidine kinase
VPAIDRERIFAPFTQLDASTTRRVGGSASGCSWSTGWSGAWGTGLGRGQPGGGARFVVELPDLAEV